jgi:hypothetical protein
MVGFASNQHLIARELIELSFTDNFNFHILENGCSCSDMTGIGLNLLRKWRPD